MIVPVPEDGVVVSRALGEALGLRVGDQPELLLREGDRSRSRPLVVGFIDDAAGLSVYARSDRVASFEGDL